MTRIDSLKENELTQTINDLKRNLDELKAAAQAAGSSVPSGGAGGDLAGSYPNPTLNTTAVTPGTYGDSTHVAQVTFDSKGRATFATNVTLPSGSSKAFAVAMAAALG